MGKTFHIIGQIVTTLVGLAMVAMGVVWILQGFGIAFLDSFMANDVTWARNGAILALVGAVVAAWANTRRGFFLRR